MIVQFRHAGRYTGDRFTIDDIIGSLTAQRELLRLAAMALPQLQDGLSVQEVEMVVERIETGSLLWDILVLVHAEYQERIDDVLIEGVESMFGVDVPPEYEALLSLVMLALTYVVMRYAYDRIARSKGDATPSVHISGENNTVVLNVARIVNQSPEHVEAVMERALSPSKRKTLIPRVADFLRPARRSEGGTIEIAGAPAMSSAAMREFPSDAALEAVDDSANIPVEGAARNPRDGSRPQPAGLVGADQGQPALPQPDAHGPLPGPRRRSPRPASVRAR